MEEAAEDAPGRAFWRAAIAVLACLLALHRLWRLHPRYGGNPGLPCFPILGSLPLILLNKHRFYEWSCELFDAAQALTISAFVGSQTTIATADPQNVHHILKSRFELYPKGPNFYPYLHDVFGRGIFNCDGPLWRFQRKVASSIFTSSSLRDFVIDVADAEISHRLLPALACCCSCNRGSPVDLQALVMDFSFDTVSQLTFGADPARLTGCRFTISKANEAVQCMEVGDAAGELNGSDCRASMAGKCFSSHVKDGGACLASQRDSGFASQRDSGFAYMKVPDDLIDGFAIGFQLALQIISNRFLTPKFVWQTKRRLRIGSEKQLHDAMKAVTKFTDFVIEKSRSESSTGVRHKDLLARFVQLSRAQVAGLLETEDEAIWKANSDEDGQALSDSLLKDILLSFLLAGRDAIASAITFLMWQLCVHPEVEKAVYEEISSIMEDRSCKHSTGTFSYEELRRMNYLHAALSESMRLNPPVPSDPKYATQDDVLPSGMRVRKGDIVSYNVFAMGRARQVWGADCLKFKPERWLGEDGSFVPVSPFKYPVFQAGLRTCLGKDFAYIQTKLVVACLVRDYKFSVASGFKPKLSFGANLLMVNGLPVIVRRRQRVSSD